MDLNETYNGRQNRIAKVLAQFPATFGFRRFPGELFRCSTQDSYLDDHGAVMVYTERFCEDGSWHAFAKGYADELRREMVRR